MRKTRKKAVWEDTMTLLGHETLGGHFRTKFHSPRHLFRTMKKMWVRDRAGYKAAMAEAAKPQAA